MDSQSRRDNSAYDECPRQSSLGNEMPVEQTGSSKESLVTCDDGDDKKANQTKPKRRKMRVPKKIKRREENEIEEELYLDYALPEETASVSAYMLSTEDGVITCSQSVKRGRTKICGETENNVEMLESNCRFNGSSDSNSAAGMPSGRIKNGKGSMTEIHPAGVKMKKRRHRLPKALNDKIPENYYFDVTARQSRKYKGQVKNYCCAHCEFTSPRWDRLKEHLIVHLQERPFACDICDYKAKTAKTLKRHKNAHTGERRFQCPHCPVAYKRKHSLKEHLNSHSKDRLFACSLCDFSTTRSQYLKRHMIKHTEDRFTCQFCDYETICCSKLKQHMESHLGSERTELYHCSRCDYTSLFIQAVREHEKTHDEGELFQCGLCEFGAVTAETLHSHMEMHLNGGNQFKCDYCDYETGRKRDMRRHYRQIHEVFKGKDF